MKIKTKTTLWIFVGLLVAGLVIWVGFLDVRSYLKYNVDAARKTGTGVPVKVASATIEELPEIIGASSLAEPTSTVEVCTSLAGRVQKVGVDIGQIVSKGQKLAEMDRTLYVAAVRSAEDNLVKTRTDVENRRLYLERMSNLYSQGVIAKVEVEEASLRADMAKYNYTKAQEELLIAQHNLQNVAISAPVNGVIIERLVNPGENVRDRKQFFVIGEMRSIMVVAHVPEEKVGSVFIGQEAEVVFDAYPNSVLKGRVEKIDPQTDPKTRTFKAYIKVKDKKLKLNPGLSAYARLKYKRQGLTIPRLAVIKNAGEATVFVVESSRARLRSIRTGIELIDKVEVLSGLQEGEQVVYYGLLKLKNGDLVNLQTLAQSDLGGQTHP